VDQLKEGGKMIVPVGPSRSSQKLLLVEKGENGEVSSKELMGVIYVPLVKTEGK